MQKYPPSEGVLNLGTVFYTGSLIIKSFPSDAEIIINGAGMGNTPLQVRGFVEGTAEVIIKKEGYHSEKRTVNIYRKQVTNLGTINLTKRRYR